MDLGCEMKGEKGVVGKENRRKRGRASAWWSLFNFSDWFMFSGMFLFQYVFSIGSFAFTFLFVCVYDNMCGFRYPL